MAEEEPTFRWAGRHTVKDALRTERWQALIDLGVNVGPVWSRIPNFVGADTAAWHLGKSEAWAKARVVKCNPDPPQIPVRLRALYEGKLLFAPVPELREGFPYVRLDPEMLKAKRVSFELAATSAGFMTHGEPVSFEEVPFMDIYVVGCVAVTRDGGRTGKGAGFADLEYGIFASLGRVGTATVIATTVHSSQVVPSERVVMLGHDAPLDMIATEAELIMTDTRYPRPKSVDWPNVQADQLRDIPFLGELRDRMQAEAART